MSRKASPVEPAVLVTIICETVLKDRIVEMLKNHSVAAIPLIKCRGGWSRQTVVRHEATTPMLKLTLVSPEISDAILWAVKEHKGKHALIAFRQNVEALS